MGLLCKISRDTQGNIFVSNNDGSPSGLFRKSVDFFKQGREATLEEQEKALDLWAIASTEDFKDATEKDENLATIEDVLSFKESQDILSSGLKPSEVYEIKSLMQNLGIPTLQEFRDRLSKVFKKTPNSFTFSKTQAIKSGLFTMRDTENLDFERIQELLDKVDGELISGNDFSVETNGEDVLYRDTESTNTFGFSGFVTETSIVEQVKKSMESFEDINLFYNAVSQTPYTDFIERVFRDKAYAESIFNKLKGLRRLPVAQVRGEEYRKNVSLTSQTIRATLPEKFKALVALKAEVQYLSDIPSVIWDDKRREVKKVLKDIEAMLAEEGVDIIGISEVGASQEDVLDLLSSMTKMLESPSVANVDSYSEKYDAIFKTSTETVVERTDQVYKGLNIVKVFTDLPLKTLFERFGLIKVAENTYHKVDLKTQISELYEYLYERMQDKTFDIPARFKTATKDDKVGQLKDIEKFVNSRDTGMDFFDERLSLFQLAFDHKPFTKNNTPQNLNQLSDIVTNKEYLKTEFILDFYKVLLKEKMLNSPIWNDKLSKFKITDGEIQIVGAIEDLEGVPMKQELIDYMRLSTNADFKRFLPASNTEVKEEILAVNRPEMVPEITGQYETSGDYLIAPFNDKVVVKAKGELFRRVGTTGDTTVFGKVLNKRGPLFNETEIFYEEDATEIARLLKSSSFIKSKETKEEKESREKKSGLKSLLFTSIAETSKKVKQAFKTSPDKAFERNLVDYLKSRGVNIETDPAAMASKLKELGYADFNAMVDMQEQKARYIAEGVFMKAPNGNNSNLNELQWLQVRTEEFKNWFGDWQNDPKNASKILDENGEPKVMYTGTSKDKDFDKFNIPRNGAWFTSDRAEASSYAEQNDSQKDVFKDGKYESVNTAGRVIPVFLNIRKLGDFNKLISPERREKLKYANNYKKLQGDAFQDIYYSIGLGQQRYDGLDYTGDGNVIVVLEKSNQIKSAIGNSGAFSTTKDKIQFMQTPAGDVLGFEYNGKIYLDNNKLNNTTTLHELIHVFQHIVETKAKQGDPKAEEIIRKRAELFQEEVDAWKAYHTGVTSFNSPLDFMILGLEAANRIPALKGSVIEANRLASEGASKEEIYNRTGWYFMKGDWKYFAPELLTQMKIKEAEIGKKYTLANVLGKDNALLKIYPELNNLKVSFYEQTETPDTYGYFTGDEIKVAKSISESGDGISTQAQLTFIHELQHAVQRIEGQAEGGSYRKLLAFVKNILKLPKSLQSITAQDLDVDLENISEDNRELVQELQRILSAVSPAVATEEFYNKILGEIDAQITELAYRIIQEGNRLPDYKPLLDIVLRSNNVLEDGTLVFKQSNLTPNFQILGERGATALDRAEEATFRLDNLAVARKMEEAGKTPKEIKLSTGWERIKGEKWAFESQDLDLKNPYKLYEALLSEEDTETTLGELLKADELFTAYPELRNYKVKIYETVNSSRRAGVDHKNGILEINRSPIRRIFQGTFGVGERPNSYNFSTYGEYEVRRLLSETISHEVSHIIQNIEGFPMGGSSATLYFYENLLTREGYLDTEKVKDFITSERDRLETERKNSSDKKTIDSISRQITFLNSWSSNLNNTDFAEDYYRRLAGEVTSRNVETRFGMTPQEKRESLLEETEDVVRSQQVVLRDAFFKNNSEAIESLSQIGLDLSSPVYAKRTDLRYLPNFQILGERGATALDSAEEATRRLDNLAVAKQMESEGKPPKEIRLATEWEKWGDGLWRWEMGKYFELKSDIKTTEDFESLISRSDKNYIGQPIIPIGELVDLQGLEAMYGIEDSGIIFNSLENIKIVLDGTVGVGEAFYRNSAIHINRNTFYYKYKKDGTFTKEGARESFQNIIQHEIQHFIQEAEGFSKPYSEDQYKLELSWNIEEAEKALESAKRIAKFEPEYAKKIPVLEQELEEFRAMKNLPQEDLDAMYWVSSGEVEARNVQKRSQMTPQQRRETLLAETEDIAREQQIVLFDMLSTAEQAGVSQIGLDLSSPVYAKRTGETDNEYNERLLREVEAFVTAPETARQLEALKEANPSLWQRITDFIKQLTSWLKGKIGLDSYQGNIMEMSREEYINALGVGALRMDYKPQEDLQSVALSYIAQQQMKGFQILDTPTEEKQQELIEKYDNCN